MDNLLDAIKDDLGIEGDRLVKALDEIGSPVADVVRIAELQVKKSLADPSTPTLEEQREALAMLDPGNVNFLLNTCHMLMVVMMAEYPDPTVLEPRTAFVLRSLLD